MLKSSAPEFLCQSTYPKDTKSLLESQSYSPEAKREYFQWVFPVTQGVTSISWRPQYWQGSNRRYWLIEGSEAPVGNCSLQWSLINLCGALSAGHGHEAAVSIKGLIPIQQSSLTGLKWVLQYTKMCKYTNNIQSKSQNPRLKHWSKKEGEENSFRIVFPPIPFELWQPE